MEISFEKANNGSKVDILLMHENERTLDSLITELSHYIEDLHGSNETLVALIGMNLKISNKKKTSVFCAAAGKNPGEVILRHPKIKGAMYHWQFTAGNGNAPAEKEWSELGLSTKASYMVQNIPREIRYWFRVASVKGQTQNEWSEAVNIMLV